MTDMPRRPGDLILDRYLPDADEATRERAREVLRGYALFLIAIGERIESEALSDSPEPAGRRTISVAPQEPLFEELSPHV